MPSHSHGITISVIVYSLLRPPLPDPYFGLLGTCCTECWGWILFWGRPRII